MTNTPLLEGLKDELIKARSVASSSVQLRGIDFTRAWHSVRVPAFVEQTWHMDIASKLSSLG